MIDRERVLDSVSTIAQEAGKIALKYFGTVRPEVKRDRSFVTRADREVERFIRESLGGAFPDEPVIGEEFGGSLSPDTEYAWAVDPIDGTTNFVAGLPHWAVCIARMREGMPVLGVVVMPALGETYSAERDGGATRNSVPFRIQDKDAPPNEQLLAVWSTWHHDIELDFPGKVRTLGSTVVKCLYTARSSFVGALTPQVHIWDIAAGLPILWEAGGEARTMEGVLYETMDIGSGFLVPPLALASPSQQDRIRGMIKPRQS